MNRIAAVLILAGAAPAAAQQPVLEPPVVEVGVQGVYARTTGEFKDHVDNGGGLNVNIVWPVPAARAFGLRADGGFVIYGTETQRVCFGGGVGCRVELDLNTTNSIAYFNAGPQLMVPSGAIRPYVNAGIGFSYFATNSSVEGSDGDDEPFATTNNHDDITLAWSAGGGVLIRVSSGKTPVSIDLSGRYNGNGEVEYVTKGGITDNPDGSINVNTTRSEANLINFQIGVSIGIRRNQN